MPRKKIDKPIDEIPEKETPEQFKEKTNRWFIDSMYDRFNGYKINILGEEWTILLQTTVVRTDEYAHTSKFGRKIVIIDRMKSLLCTHSKMEIINILYQSLRHEIVHAFLAESGLYRSSNEYKGPWPMNEEMVDWFAVQSPKIFRAYQELGIECDEDADIVQEIKDNLAIINFYIKAGCSENQDRPLRDCTPPKPWSDGWDASGYPSDGCF